MKNIYLIELSEDDSYTSYEQTQELVVIAANTAEARSLAKKDASNGFIKNPTNPKLIDMDDAIWDRANVYKIGTAVSGANSAVVVQHVNYG